MCRQRYVDISRLSPPVQDWLRFRAQVLTEFMRELCGLLKQAGKRRKISAVVFGNEVDNLFYGLDIEAWVKEGLVDIIIPYPWPGYSGTGYFSEIDLAFFTRITNGSACQVYPNVLPKQMEPGQYLKKALQYYDQGADGLAFWDTNARHPLLNQWQAVRELGHKDQLREWLENERFRRKLLLLRRLGDYTMDRYHAHTGG